MTDTCQERQINELDALKSIFNDQLKDCNENNGDWKPLDIIITVFPEGFTNFEKSNIVVDLHVKASDDYPNEIPFLQLENAKGISSNYLKHLEKQLNELAFKIIGEVMIFELIQYIQNYLSLYNKPQFASIYEEMISRKALKQIEDTELQNQKVELTKQLIQTEVSKKIEALKIESKMLKNNIKTNHLESLIGYNEEENILQVACSPNKRNIKSEDLMDENNYDNHIFDYNCSFRSRLDKEFDTLDWLGKGAYGDVFKVKNKLDGCLYAIKCIKLNKNNILLNKKITKEVKLLSRLNHENVVRYFNSWIEAITPEETHQKKNEINEKCSLKDNSYPWKLSNLVDEFNFHSSSSDEEESDWIQFIQDYQSNPKNDITENTYCDNSINTNENLNIKLDQYMYIQMEFCEKSTLRNAVDNGLYNEPSRVWRLLREIVEGLSYIHQQGIIHRDLKPVNIFIDFDDHVKIGDFGLATNIIQRHIPDVDANTIQDVFNDSSQTSNIGTTLYVAPELNISSPKTVYNEKVDIYSLGIIFFEMCHKPFSTAMERIKVLSELRMYDCILPTNFLKTATLDQIHFIKWLLNHDPYKRPNSTEILQSKYIPLPQLKDTELHEMIKYTLSNSNSKNYKHIIESFFKQKVTTVEDITFNISIGKNILQYDRLNNIIDIVKSVFQVHGGVWFCTSLLMPASNNIINDSAVNLMTCWGGLICLPYNLRIPFARFLAHNPTISNLKRYSIDRVYRPRKVYGVHPRELYEAAFDIVSPSQDPIAEAELLLMATEIFKKLKDFNHNNCVIRLNHMSLVQGILMYSGIEKARHLSICSYFAKFKQKYLSQEQIDELVNLGFANHQINLAMNFFSMEHTLDDLIEKFRKITVRKSKCGIFSREGLCHLETVIKHLNSLNVKIPIVVAPGLMNIMQYYSGLIFEIVYKTNKKNSTEYEVLSAGGRYDKLISSFKKNLVSNDITQTAIGISFSLDKLAVLFQTELSKIDVILCSSSNTMTEEKLSIARDLWMIGIKTLVLDKERTLEQIQDDFQDLSFSNIVMLKETKSIILRHLIGDRFEDKSLSVSEFITCMRNKNLQNNITNISQINSSVKNDLRPTIDNQFINIIFFTEEKLITSVKRRYESQILNTVSKTIQKLSSKTRVEILVLNVQTELIKSLSIIDISSLENDISVLIKRYSHHKKDLNKVFNYFNDTKNKNTDTVFIFYTLRGNTFKLFFV